MLSATDIRKLHDKGFTNGQTTREKAADDLLFYWISQWDSQFLNGVSLEYRGQFDMLRKAGRQITSDIKANPTQVNFEPVDGTDPDAGDLLDGMYRTDTRNNAAQEAKENATTESIVCGVGAWELRHEYKTNRRGDSKQVIRRYPLYEANNQIFWDPNAKLQDKSDADWVSCLIAYSEDGYKELVFDLTGEEIDDVPGSFAWPEHSYVYPWVIGDSEYYVTRFYYREKIKVKTMIWRSLLGEERMITEEDFDDMEEFLADNDFELISETEKEQYQIHLYIVGGGDEVLDRSIIAGENIPVVPVYGERAFVEGEEHYEGITRLAKDPQRLRNFQMSYLADIVSKSPRTKPIFFADQIQGFEFMYEENGADSNYPYMLQNRKDANGNELPQGAIAQMPESPAPTALIQSIQLSQDAINDVASSDLPGDYTDTNLSGKALTQIQKRFDMQSYNYQHNLRVALRRDGEIYASMASVIYDSEQEVVLTKVDGTRANEIINQEEINPQNLQLETKNDVTNFVFDVYADIGPAYQTVKEEAKTELKEMFMSMAPDDPKRDILMLEYMTLQDGLAFKSMRDYARKQLILQGIKEPETEEEQIMVMQAQQAQANQPDPQMMMLMAEAQARTMEGQAALQNEENDRVKNEIELYKAQTDRGELELKAAETGANIKYKDAQTDGVRIDNVGKVTGSDLRRSA